ncbi:hypothetical protein [Zobellia laminariae]|uniref:hypothetical protein n=1 Tax=Zobellia laminariae TaxID=248906 RepID=UPI0026F42E65|nr:hypothetical protein [Zobellia laminariae]WKX77841.1 hypothetical protein Q5W13_07705 [Zobellia laminariae]
MKTSKIFTIILLSGLSLTGCTADFEETNTNPNAPEMVSANLLTATATSEIARTLTSEGYSDGNTLTQLMAKNNFLALVNLNGEIKVFGIFSMKFYQK